MTPQNSRINPLDIKIITGMVGRMKEKDTSGAHLWLILWKASNALRTYDTRSIDALGICLSDFAVLEVLLHRGPHPVNAIGRKVGLTSGSITTAIDRMEAKRYVERKPSTEDGRVIIVRLTERGRHFIEQAYEQHAKRLEHAVAILNTKERSDLITLLRKLGKSVESKL